MIGPEHEEVRPAEGPGFSEWVAFAWADEHNALCGSVRIGLAAGQPASFSGLGLLFRETEVVAAAVCAAEDRPDPDWRHVAVGAVTAEVLEPLGRWRVELDDGQSGFDLTFSALTDPAEAAEELSGLTGYEQLCAVEGEVRAAGASVTVSCLGQRGRHWGVADWDGVALTRQVSAWFAPDAAIMLSAARPARARGHAEEAISAFLVEQAAESEETVISEVTEPRLSTVFDADGRQRRAGTELWVGEEDGFPRRAAGEAVCGTSLELGRLRLDASFFRWRMEGREGLGRYDVLRRA